MSATTSIKRPGFMEETAATDTSGYLVGIVMEADGGESSAGLLEAHDEAAQEYGAEPGREAAASEAANTAGRTAHE
jgi:hypothetical protein